ncbi:MAG: efflux RND transporter periplasmic adaptor subunit, partial [Pseudomonadota bacterium]
AEASARVPEAQARVPEAQAMLAEAEARVDEAEINQNAAVRLSQDGFASTTRVASADAAMRAAEAGRIAAETGLETTQAGIESALAGVQSAEAALERARQEIEKLTIEAPFDGLLETDTAELGLLLREGTPCATVVQLDPMKLVGFLPEAQVDRVTFGAAARATLASGGEAVGRVTFVSRSADELTRTFRVEVTVPNDDLSIRDGQTAEILIETDPTIAHLIPASALTLNDEGVLGVRVVENGITGFMPTTLVRDTVDGVLVAGLPPEVQVITVGQEYVTDGVPVEASYADPVAQSEATQ